MKKNVTIVFVMVLLLLISLACCKTKVSNEISEKSSEQVEKVTKSKEDIDINNENVDRMQENDIIEVDNIQKEIDSIKENIKKVELPVHPDNKRAEGKYAGLDNSLKSWWYRKGKDDVSPSTNPDIAKLIQKYDGIFIENTDQKVLYLTFDEGYENGYTPKILDALKKHNVPAAFFITGPYLKTHTDLVKRMVDEGHMVGNHTVNHPSMPGIADERKLEEEILGVERSYYEIFQQNMKYFRPPMGEYSERTLAITKDLGYKTVFWSFAYVDWDVNNQKGTEYAYNKVMDELYNGTVLLLHAVSKDNAEAMEKIILGAREKGFEFKSLDDFQLEKNKTPSPSVD